MTSQKIIVVVAATGLQGSSVAKTFLNLPGWRVRGLTRNTASAKAKELSDLGAEMVQADLSNIESLHTAFQGAHAIFVNTDFWEPFHRARESGLDMDKSRQIGYDTEVQNAKNTVIAASQIPTLERFVYSALGPMSAASGGKYNHSHHWETKAAVVDWIEKEQPEISKKASFLYPAAYASNKFLIPQWNPQSSQYELIMPGPRTMKVPIIDPAQSMGPFVRVLVEVEEPGVKLLGCDSDPTIEEVVNAWTEVTGKEAHFIQMDIHEMHKTTGLPYEVLDGAGFMGEHDFMDGVEGSIRPEDLKEKVKTRPYLDYLREQSKETLLGSDWDKF